ncbi:hypothetical protein GDO86_003577 [Hymenochirus boettgeri]|uniref:Uncharacterized protein n=1 Tax=Hymenochirus boettgeri TaxID=247094 RepID=A0A8T2K1K8_9PIPI|nr:hypothetical protein GDO86_003577 [Hymenochirus boettgeri]
MYIDISTNANFIQVFPTSTCRNTKEIKKHGILYLFTKGIKKVITRNFSNITQIIKLVKKLEICKMPSKKAGGVPFQASLAT